MSPPNISNNDGLLGSMDHRCLSSSRLLGVGGSVGLLPFIVVVGKGNEERGKNNRGFRLKLRGGSGKRSDVVCLDVLCVFVNMSQRRAVLTLYSSILHTHRARLPDHMRQLGDSYVRCVNSGAFECSSTDLATLAHASPSPTYQHPLHPYIVRNSSGIKKQTQNLWPPS